MARKVESLMLAGVAGGVVASLVEIIPGGTGCLTCAVYVGSGVLAVWHYANTYALTVPGTAGAGLGAGAALLSTIVSALLNYLISLLGARPGFREQIETGLDAMEDAGMGPEQIEQIRMWISTPSFLVTAIVFGLVITAGLGAMGGLIGAGAFRKGDQPPAE